MKKSLGLFVALAFTPSFSLSFALLHGSILNDERVTFFSDDPQHGSPKGALFDSLKAFTMKENSPKLTLYGGLT